MMTAGTLVDSVGTCLNWVLGVGWELSLGPRMSTVALHHVVWAPHSMVAAFQEEGGGSFCAS